MSPSASILDTFTVAETPIGQERTVRTGRSGFRFGLFLVLTAIIFLRPTDLIPELAGYPIYESVILLCAIASLPVLVNQLRWRTLKPQPWTLCVIGLLPAILLADLSHGNIYGARTNGLDFLKILVYYLLLLGLVDSAARLRTFLVTVAILVTVLAALTLLEYHQVINIPALAPMIENPDEINSQTGESAAIVRLMAAGIFHDPNDFSLILGASIMIGLYWIIDRKNWLLRISWLLAIGILTYAFALTRSRGGFLALMAGLAVVLASRFGRRRSLSIALVLFPLILIIFGGRQTSIDISDANDTGQGRIHLWRDSMALFKTSPVFGIGVGQLAEANELVAHNSYVHALAELGLFGGMFFVGAWYVLFLALRRPVDVLVARPHDGSVVELRPYVLGMLSSYAVGLYSLTRCYAVSTYLVLGAAGVTALLLPWNRLDGAARRFGPSLWLKVAFATVALVVFMDIFVRVLAT